MARRPGARSALALLALVAGCDLQPGRAATVPHGAHRPDVVVTARASLASGQTPRDAAVFDARAAIDATDATDSPDASVIDPDARAADAIDLDAYPELPAPPIEEPEALPPVTLTGCPPPPRPRPTVPPVRPWRPTHLVPEDTLPAPDPPAPRGASLAVLRGSGVWIWRARFCENGDAAAIVTRAQRAHIRQLWVRVGDSHDGFYGAPVLESLVPLAHAAGIAVIGWGFPFLWDPVGDATWTRAALEWHTASGESLDGFSPDLETSSEGVRLTARRVVLYLSLVRPAAARTHRPLVATVFRPTQRLMESYPYQDMAPYIDAFAPMVYWSCREPGAAGASAVRMLSPLAPVHVLGQGYDMTDEGGRTGMPTGAEIARFCDASRRAGAMGASLWHWQTMTDDEWAALSACWWRPARRARERVHRAHEG